MKKKPKIYPEHIHYNFKVQSENFSWFEEKKGSIVSWIALR